MVRFSVPGLFLFLTGAGALFPYGERFNDDNSAKTEKVYIRHVDSVHDRSKRDARTLPTSLVLALERAGGSSSLNLTLGRDPSHIRLFKHVNGTEEPVHVPRNPDIGIYSDKKGTGLMVERTGRDQYIVAGMYNDGEYIHDIYPAHRHRRNEINGLVSGSHIIRRAKVDLGGKIDIILEKKVEERRRALTRIERGAANRVERDALAQIRTIEIIFYSDAADWQNFVTIANGNTADAFADALTFFGLLEECMNFNYNSIPADQLCIDIECKKLTIFMTAGTPDWVYNNQVGNTYNGDGILDAMSGTQATNLGPASALDPNFDHWALFTGENLVGSDGQGGFVNIAGLAFQGTLCTASSDSVNENTQGVATFTTASHELGHSQNLMHDSLVGCNDTDGFIMATSFSFPDEDMPGNYFSFSSCSIRDLIAFYADRGQCTLTVDVATDEFNPDLMGRLAGQIYNVDAQCNRRRNGDDLCRLTMAQQDPSTYCQTIFCGSSESLPCDAVTPLQGTTCGDQRWCINGSCVFDARAPRRPENCPFGDEPDFLCNEGRCESFFALCCEFCSPPITEPTTEAVTVVTTETVTDVTTEAVTDVTTEAVTDVTTEAVTELTTEAVTVATTEVVTDVTTEAVTDVTTEAVTDVTTEAVTELTTEAVTVATTDAGTTAEDATATDATTGPPATTAAPSPGQQPGAVLSTTVFIIQSCY